ncbi:MAG TPA: hypothetical protein ENI66_00150 [Candidatus Yonathbacteria bacterium]|nr:hypothetical protein [Candidatus Yonathbacteria bacterium]
MDNKKYKKIPSFKSEKDERLFWHNKDSTEYINWSKAEKNPTFPNLKPSTRTISIRLPESMLTALKMEANGKDIPYQSLMKEILSQHQHNKNSTPSPFPLQAILSQDTNKKSASNMDNNADKSYKVQRSDTSTKYYK